MAITMIIVVFIFHSIYNSDYLFEEYIAANLYGFQK